MCSVSDAFIVIKKDVDKNKCSKEGEEMYACQDS